MKIPWRLTLFLISVPLALVTFAVMKEREWMQESRRRIAGRRR